MQFITKDSAETKKLGKLFAEEFRGCEIICLTGDLGAGKTTFTQGMLQGLKIKGPYTSPTFAIIKQYGIKNHESRIMQNQSKTIIHNSKFVIQHVYHIDAYRVNAKDISDLGWKDFAGKKNSIVIVEWAERIKKLIPTQAVWIRFKWLNDKEREINFPS